MERNDDTLQPSQRQQTGQRGTPMRLAAVHPHSNLHTKHMEHMEHIDVVGLFALYSAHPSRRSGNGARMQTPT
ncbi:uncharacterized protein SPSK_05772 [Sporothrix schenckii 1099-18]|uniref:Uncharacterized protein n=1 Tax=Sporothrix schenckii 1099-18 TaxID=1397361 RepID=A0A0F2LU78_SPOSC|nr:uncharacterized protein SPSK_05772 [Sporothrix schenckii 1099-18]KJR81023.1 hypothetical protein SPSK_05772 [Sporothrix schenckii 1099-18]